MSPHFPKAAGFVFVAFAQIASAQAPQTAAPPAAVAPPLVPNPTYISIQLDIMVNRPVADVWKRVGKFCDVAEFVPVPCTITSGRDGELGAVRSAGNGEILVGKTEFSYTYTQPPRVGRPYNLYHATLEARPVTATTTKLVFALMWDNSMVTDTAAREAERTQRTTRFKAALDNMKILAEGGTLPPPKQ